MALWLFALFASRSIPTRNELVSVLPDPCGTKAEVRTNRQTLFLPLDLSRSTIAVRPIIAIVASSAAPVRAAMLSWVSGSAPVLKPVQAVQ